LRKNTENAIYLNIQNKYIYNYKSTYAVKREKKKDNNFTVSALKESLRFSFISSLILNWNDKKKNIYI
jgi:hypothetical protein